MALDEQKEKPPMGQNYSMKDKEKERKIHKF